MQFSSNALLLIKKLNTGFKVQNGDELIEEFEGCYLKAYHGTADKPGVYTIGWGSTHYEDGATVKKGDVISQDRADALLMWEINQKCVPEVNRMVSGIPGVTQNMFDALISFTYNLGTGALKSSTLLKKMKVNPLDPTIYKYNAAKPEKSCEFLKWIYSNGKVWKGLIRRRMSEADLYKA